MEKQEDECIECFIEAQNLVVRMCEEHGRGNALVIFTFAQGKTARLLGYDIEDYRERVANNLKHWQDAYATRTEMP